MTGIGNYKPRLLAPGPVEVPPAVLAAMAKPTIHHRPPRPFFFYDTETTEIYTVHIVGSVRSVLETGYWLCMQENLARVGQP